jgi:hypothetical protein
MRKITNNMIQTRILIAVVWFASAVTGRAQSAAPVPVLPLAPGSPVLPARPVIVDPFGHGVISDLHDELERANHAIDSANHALSIMPLEPFHFNFNLNEPHLLAQNAPFQIPIPGGRGGGDDNLYQNGQNALDNSRWDQALQNFSQVAARGGPRADGATYWKAYALNKLGRRDEALAAIAELRKTFTGSRWLEDAGVLELEMKQAAGQSVTPENQSDEELKLLALNGLMQSDAQRALPLIENLLKSAQSPKLKKNAVYVLAQNGSPRARQVLEQIARGGNNPDLQATAIRYLGERGDSGQLLWEIYGSTSDGGVKRQILSSFSSRGDRDHLTQIAKTEKDTSLRLTAIRQLGAASYGAELVQLYQTEASTDVKRQILSTLASSGNTDRLMEIIRTEKDPNLRRFAIQQLAATGGLAGDSLLQLYSSEQDEKSKQAIVDALASQNNVKALVSLARAEKDVQMKRRIVQKLSGISSPEAADYLAELLK